MAQPNSASLAQSWSVSPGPAPISYSLGLWSSALPLCAACVRAAWVHCPCALPGCRLCARPVGVACACGLWTLPMRVACGRCLCPLHGRGLCTLHGRCSWALSVHVAWALCLCALPVHVAWALPVQAAWALSTRSWHCTHDHQPMCAGIECPMP